MNAQGDLEGLTKPFSSNAGQELLASFINKYLYREALSYSGILGKIEKAISEKAFSTFKKKLVEWKGNTKASTDIIRWLAAVINHTSSPTLVKESIPFWRTPRDNEPDLWPYLSKVTQEIKNYETQFEWPNQAEPLSGKALVEDISRLMHSEKLVERLSNLLSDKATPALFESMITALFETRSKNKELYFESIGFGLREIFLSEHLNQVLRFSHITNKKSEGLFIHLNESLKKKSDILKFSDDLRAFVVEAIAKSIEEELSQPPYNKKWWLSLIPSNTSSHISDSFIQLFLLIQGHIEKFIGVSKSATETNHFHFNAPIFLNAFVITKSIGQLIAANRETLTKLGEDAFQLALWSRQLQPIPDSMAILELIDRKEGKYVLATPLGLEFESLVHKIPESDSKHLRGFLQYFKQLISAQLVSKDDYYYDFRVQNPTQLQSLSTTLEASLIETNEVLTLASGMAMSRALLFFMVRPDSEALLTLKSLESENMLASLQGALPAFSIQQIRNFHSWVERFFLGEQSTAYKEAILGLFEETPHYHSFAAECLDLTPAILELDRVPRKEAVPSTFESYHHLMHFIDHHSQIPQLGHWLDWFYQTQMFKRTEHPIYPSVQQLIEKGRPIAAILSGFSYLDSEIRPHLTIANQALLKDPVVQSLFDLLRHLTTEEAKLTTQVIETLINGDEDMSWAPSIENAKAAREFLARFVREGDFEEWWHFTRSELSPAELLEFVQALKTVSQTGRLKRAFVLLQTLKNENIQKIGEIFYRWDDSGELGAFFDIWEILLQPLSTQNEGERFDA